MMAVPTVVQVDAVTNLSILYIWISMEKSRMDLAERRFLDKSENYIIS
jgi:hypothetical protein